MKPNVGSSVTSGQTSDVGRGSQNLSSTTGDPWGVPVGAKQPLMSPGQHLVDRGDKSLGSSNDADIERGRTRLAEYVQSGKVFNRAYPSHGNVATAAHNNNAQSATGQRADNFTHDSDFTDTNVTAGSQESSLACADLPSSASELRRAMSRQGMEQREPSRSDRKQGFFLIPKQNRRSGSNVYKYHRALQEEVPEDVALSSGKSGSRRLVSPSRRRDSGRQLAPRQSRDRAAEERAEKMQDRAQPATPRTSLSTSHAGSPANAGVRVVPSEDKEPLGGRRKAAAREQHPAKLYSCRPPTPFPSQIPQPSRDDGGSLMNGENTSHVKEDNSDSHYKAGRRGRSARGGLHTMHLLADPMLLKASSMSASFPNVSTIRQPSAAIPDSKTSKTSRAKLKRVKSHEDYAYVNMGSTFFDDPLRAASVSGPVPDTSAGKAQLSSFPVEPRTSAGTEQRRQHQNGLSNAKTDSQILAEVMNSFPQSVSPHTTRTDHAHNNDGLLGTLYPDMTIPTAFADELFGIWSLSPEHDISPSQPRTPLMTPLKDEAKRANSKFIWGNSGSPSGSASTSSFALVWLPQEEGVGVSEYVLAHQKDADDDSDDYVEMDNDGSGQLQNDRNAEQRVSPAQMSISDPTSSEPIPPTPTLDDVKKRPDLNNEADGLGVGDDYKGLPLNNLHLSQRYVISGDPGNDDFNNNSPATSTTNTSRMGVDATNASPCKVTGTSNDLGCDRESAPSAFAIVLDEHKFWL